MFLRTTAQLLHPAYVSDVLIRTQRFFFFRWALLTVSCYRSITHLSSENYFTATMLKVIVKHQCLFPLKCRMSCINASFQTERLPPGKSPHASCQKLANNRFRKKCSAFLKSFTVGVSLENKEQSCGLTSSHILFFFSSRFFPSGWGHKDEAEKVRFTPADESSKPSGTQSFKIIRCQIFFETFDISFETVCLYC